MEIVTDPENPLPFADYDTPGISRRAIPHNEFVFTVDHTSLIVLYADFQTGIPDNNDVILPDKILLSNYPNPFNAATRLSYMLPRSGPVTITIYNLLGQRVATIYEGEKQAGQHTITWNASAFPSGVYFARLEAGEYSKSIKMVLLK